MSEQLIATPGVFGENGNFLLERELGSGGMGGVYMGRDKMLDRPVAVKVMLKEFGSDAEFVERFNGGVIDPIRQGADSAVLEVLIRALQVRKDGVHGFFATDGCKYLL